MPTVRRAFDILAAITVVAAVTMLVRPGSKGPQLVAAIGSAFVAATAGAVGAPLTPDTQIPGTSSTPTAAQLAGGTEFV